MNYLSIFVGVCSLSVGLMACSSDDSGGGTGATGGSGAGTATGGFGGGILDSGTGGTGATATGGTGATGTGGVANCPGTIQGQKCNALQTNVPAETACIQGQCCAAVDACLADAACSSFVACGSACLQAGGTPQTCGTQCQSCLGASSGLYTTFTTCVTNCASGDGGTTDSGTTDAGASDAASD